MTKRSTAPARPVRRVFITTIGDQLEDRYKGKGVSPESVIKHLTDANADAYKFDVENPQDNPETPQSFSVGWPHIVIWEETMENNRVIAVTRPAPDGRSLEVI